MLGACAAGVVVLNLDVIADMGVCEKVDEVGDRITASGASEDFITALRASEGPITTSGASE